MNELIYSSSHNDVESSQMTPLYGCRNFKGCYIFCNGDSNDRDRNITAPVKEIPEPVPVREIPQFISVR